VGTTTGEIDIWSDSAGLPTTTDLTAKLEALPNIGAGSVTVTMAQVVVTGTAHSVTFSVTFTGDDVAGNVPDLVIVDGQDIRKANADSEYGLAATVSVDPDFNRGNEPTGEFLLWYTCEDFSEPTNYESAHEGKSADCYAIPTRASNLLSHYISAQDLETKLQAIPTVGDVTVTRTTINDGAKLGYSWVVTFLTNHGDLSMLDCAETSHSGTPLAGSGGTASSSHVECAVTEELPGSMLSGNFDIVDSACTPNCKIEGVDWEVSAADLKTLLEAVTNPVDTPVTVVGEQDKDWQSSDGTDKTHGTVIVTRTANPPTGKWSGGWRWEIEWTNRLGDVPPQSLSYSTSLLTTSANPVAANTEVLAGNEIGDWDWSCVYLKDSTNMPASDCAMTSYGYKLVYDDMTANSKFNPGLTAAEFETDFNAQFFGADKVNVVRTGPTKAMGFTYTIEFVDKSTGEDQPPITLAAQPDLTAEGVQVSFFETIKGNELLGSFKLVFGGYTTAEIPFDAPPEDMEAKLNNLESIHPSRVQVSRSSRANHQNYTVSQVNGYHWTITFTSHVWHDPTDHQESKYIEGNWEGPPASWTDEWSHGYSKAWGKNVGDMPNVGCDKTSLFTSAGTNTELCVQSLEIEKGRFPLGGMFTVSLDSRDSNGCLNACRIGFKDRTTSASIAHNAVPKASDSGGDGSSMEEILEQMDNIGDVSVSRSQTATQKEYGGYTWTVTFIRDDAEYCEEKDTAYMLCNSPGDVPKLEVSNSTETLKGNDRTIEVFDKNETGPSAAGTDYAAAVLDGHVLRATFTRFRVSTTDTTDTSLTLPWNAQTTAVKQKLEEQVPGGIARTVEVSRTVIGQYGVVEWVVTFTKNPEQTPPGTGNINAIEVDQGIDFYSMYGDGTTQITETQPGSEGLSGSFTVDYVSPGGPRTVSFQETSQRLELKFDEMTTIADVHIEREMYPSNSGGGWNDVHVADGTRGGYIWKVRFLRQTGTYDGMSFPPGSGNADTITIGTANLNGDGKDVSVYVHQEGSTPMAGTFTLSLLGKTTSALEHSIDDVVLKQELEAIDAVESVSCTTADLTGMQLRAEDTNNAAELVIKRDEEVAAVSTADLTRYLSPGDTVRIGGSSIETGLSGSNGDTLLSEVNVQWDSPIVSTNEDLGGQTTLGAGAAVVPRQQIRVAGDVYDVSRTGSEMQTITVSDFDEVSAGALKYKLRFLNNGIEATTDCIKYHATAAEVEAHLNGLSNVGAQNVLVTRKFESSCVARKLVDTNPALCPSGTSTNYTYKVYFEGTNVVGDVNQLEVLDGDCDLSANDTAVATSTVKQGGHVEVQKITLAVDSGEVSLTDYYQLGLTPLSGTPETTACIKWGASASAVETALETLSFFEDNIASTDVKVTRSGSGSSVTEVQKLSVTSNEPVSDSGSGGYFRLRFGDELSSCLNYHATAEQVLLELEGMAGIEEGHVRVTRAGDASATVGYGYSYTFEFKGPKEGGTSTLLGDVEEIQIVSQGVSPCFAVASGAPSYSMLTTRQGVPSYTYMVYFVGSTLSDLPLLEVAEEATAGHSSVCGATEQFIHSAGSVRDVKIQQVTEGSSGEVQIVTVSASDVAASGGLYKLSAANFNIAKKQEFIAQVSDTMTFSASDHDRKDGDRVYVTSDDVIPAGLDDDVEYYVKNVLSGPSTFELSQVSASGATSDIMALGRGTLQVVTKIPMRAHVNTEFTLSDTTVTNHNMADTTTVYVTQVGSSLPSNIIDGRWGQSATHQQYFIHDPGATTFKLTETFGDASTIVEPAEMASRKFEVYSGFEFNCGSAHGLDGTWDANWRTPSVYTAYYNQLDSSGSIVSDDKFVCKSASGAHGFQTGDIITFQGLISGTVSGMWVSKVGAEAKVLGVSTDGEYLSLCQTTTDCTAAFDFTTDYGTGALVKVLEVDLLMTSILSSADGVSNHADATVSGLNT